MLWCCCGQPTENVTSLIWSFKIHLMIIDSQSLRRVYVLDAWYPRDEGYGPRGQWGSVPVWGVGSAFFPVLSTTYDTSKPITEIRNAQGQPLDTEIVQEIFMRRLGQEPEHTPNMLIDIVPLPTPSTNNDTETFDGLRERSTLAPPTLTYVNEPIRRADLDYNAPDPGQITPQYYHGYERHFDLLELVNALRTAKQNTGLNHYAIIWPNWPTNENFTQIESSSPIIDFLTIGQGRFDFTFNQIVQE